MLGRSNDAAIFVDDVGASRHHAKITIGDCGATLEDLANKNGTTVNGTLAERPVLLANGARVVIGSTTLILVAFDTPGSTETQVDKATRRA